MVLNDKQIIAAEIFNPTVETCVREVGGRKVVSYGTGSYGYDLRLGSKFLRPKVLNLDTASGCLMTDALGILDVREVLDDEYEEASPVEWNGGLAYLIPPHGFVLGVSRERITMPPDVTGVCYAKSTYARVGLVMGITPLEAGWSGYLTIEISNTTDKFVPVYVDEGICQVILFKGEPCAVPYNERVGGGKYDGQPEKPVLPKV